MVTGIKSFHPWVLAPTEYYLFSFVTWNSSRGNENMSWAIGLDAKGLNHIGWFVQTRRGPLAALKCCHQKPAGDQQRSRPPTGGRKVRKEGYSQMKKPSCWGGKDPAASGTDTPGTPAFCTCLHLGTSTLRSDMTNNKELQNFVIVWNRNVKTAAILENVFLDSFGLVSFKLDKLINVSVS